MSQGITRLELEKCVEKQQDGPFKREALPLKTYHLRPTSKDKVRWIITSVEQLGKGVLIDGEHLKSTPKQ